VELAHDWAIDELWVQHLCHDFAESSLPAEYASMRDFVNEQTLLGEDQEHVEQVFAAVRAAGKAIGVHVRLPSCRANPHPPGTPGPKRCDWPWARAYVSYQGLAMPCCTIATPDRFNFGSMKEHGFAQIWNSPAYDDFRLQLSSETPPDICRTCSVYQRTF
jgi:radical SAM protein with 4Fe4S-binding SPASM domain